MLAAICERTYSFHSGQFRTIVSISQGNTRLSRGNKSPFSCGFFEPSGTNHLDTALSEEYARADEKRGKSENIVPIVADVPQTPFASAPQVRTSNPRERLACAMECNAQGLWRFFLVRVGGDENLAEELMQELSLQATRSFTAPEKTQNLDAWLFGVARNVLRRHWRTITRRRRNLPEARVDVGAELADMLDSTALPIECLERREVREQVLLALTSLSTDEQNLILQHYFDGQSQTDIASAHGVSPRAIEGRLYRARQALRDKLQHLEHELG